MATLIEIADSADVPLEGVLRVINDEPVSEVVAERVKQAIEIVGPPHPRLLEDMNLLASPEARPRGAVRGELLTAGRDGGSEDAAQLAERLRHQLQETFSSTTPELAENLSPDVVNVVYEAMRIEVQPVTERMHHMGTLFEELTRVVRQLDAQVGTERTERLDDLKLLVELISTGWQGVDRRLARVERILQRLDEQSSGTHARAR